jgi:hypothetical protein
VPSRAGAHEDQAIDPFLRRLLGMANVDDVVEDDAAVAVGRHHDLGRRAQARDDDRDLVLHADGHVVADAIVRGMDDLVDRERRGLLAGLLLMIVEFVFDALDPFVEHLGGARVQRRERTHDASLALRDDQIGARDDEERRPDDGDREAVLQDGR